MSNPNFVSDLVAMAKAFEELPVVQERLNESRKIVDEYGETIQRLELRLIDLKNEVNAAHAATTKVEVERDHAERMFLETDDRLNAFRRLLGSFQTEAGALIAAAEPEVKPEPEVLAGQPISEPLPAESVNAEVSQGERAADPTTAHTQASNTEAPQPSSWAAADTSVASVESTSTEAVSVPSDPTPVTLDVQQAPASSSANAGETSATTETAGSTQHEEAAVARPTDPTVSVTHTETGADATSTGASESNAVSASTTTEQSDTSTSASVDDVGYHNEPKIASGGGAEAWAEWDGWCERMNRRYPASQGGWPQRQQAAQ